MTEICKHGHAINEGHWTEIIDRIHVVNMNVHDHLLNHPISCADDEINAKLTEAADALTDAYQLAGLKAPE